jgi:hypothetical protein
VQFIYRQKLMYWQILCPGVTLKDFLIIVKRPI